MGLWYLPGKMHCCQHQWRTQNQISLYDQFKDAKGFQLVGSIDSLTCLNIQINDKKNITAALSKNYYKLDSAKMASFQQLYPNTQFLILDTMGLVRKLYVGGKEDMKRIAGHITVLLPLYIKNNSTWL